MRVFVFAAILLASSILAPSFAQQEGTAPVAVPQTGAPAQTDQNPQQQQDQRTGRDQPRADDRGMGRDFRMHHGGDDRMGRDDREMDRDRGTYHNREAGGERGMDRERYRDRGDGDRDRADRGRTNRDYSDQDRPRHRLKVCVEYENGDEYCRYKE
jgi:hypothetical protein